jgi:formylglycine-generating enzyme required for sulfatase activity
MPPDPELVRSDFICLFFADLERGSLRSRREYLDLYPGCESVVAEEWARLREACAPPRFAPSRAAPPPPARMLGPYRIGRELGRGGQGTVYEAIDTRLGRKVALKVLKPSLAGTAVTVARFEQEARLLARLDHPSIAGIHDAGSLHGLPFIAMRHVEGTTLAKEISGRGASPVGRRAIARYCALIETVARALHVAHEAGVVHRDVKPGNLMITPGGDPVILDFGLARLRDAGGPSMTATGDVLGTPAFMAPEQMAGDVRRIDRRADVFGLAATLHEAITRGVAHPGAPAAVRAPARRLNPAVSRDLDAVLRVGLDPDPDRRYGSAASFADDLARVRLGMPVDVRPPGALRRFVLWCRRAPAAAALLVVPPVSLAIALVAFALKNAEVQAAAVTFAEKKAEADAAAAEAQDRFLDFQRLDDLRRVEELRELGAELWPAHPKNEPAIAKWLGAARELEARYPEHRRALDLLRRRGAASLSREPGTDPAMDQVLHLRRVRAAAVSEGSKLPDRYALDQELAETVRIAEARIQRLEEGLASRPLYRFESLEDQWLHDRLAQLVLEIEELTRESGPRDTIASMTARLRDAREIEVKTIADPAAAWASAVSEIADREKCPHYGGLVITPVLGLVPLGRDPVSGLHEFAHVMSGVPPSRDRQGRLVLSEDASIVLVLVPGGRTLMGARRPGPGGASRDHADPHVRPPEEPVNEVTLDPYFISKYEVTQGQWLRAAGTSPSHHRPGRIWAGGYEPNLRHPVEQVSWEECEDVLRRLGLTLPTEAQWERAARAGTTTPWWCGESEDSLRALENLADRTANAVQGLDRPDERREDGWAGPAPVGTWPANPFGLHDVVGNVAEWCRDLIATYAEPPLPGDGLRCGIIEKLRVIRGGDYRTPARTARSAFRYGGNAANRDAWTGVRPALSVRRP